MEGHTESISTLAKLAAVPLVLSGSRDGTVQLWDIESGTSLAILRGHDAPVVAVYLSPNGSRAFSGDNAGGIRIWDKVRY